MCFRWLIRREQRTRTSEGLEQLTPPKAEAGGKLVQFELVWERLK